jgi:hypothetical protein
VRILASLSLKPAAHFDRRFIHFHAVILVSKTCH